MSSDPVMRFPFSAISGMDDAKRAIMCALVNPGIRTVLISGPSGTAKSTLSRSAAGISGRAIVNIPTGITDEQLFGGLDIGSTLKNGVPTVRKGLLGSADGAVLYFDDINLADDRTVASLFGPVLCGRAAVERDGISSSYDVDTILIATMNPGERELSDHILDRFDICAYVVEGERKDEVVKRALAFMDDPAQLFRMFAEEDDGIRSRIDRAKEILPSVRMSDELLMVAVELCTRVGADGHRGDIALTNTAKSLAALNGRDEVLKKDIEEAAVLCLAHRRNYSPVPPPPGKEEEEEDEDDVPDQGPDDGTEREKKEQDRSGDASEKRPPSTDIDGAVDDILFEIGEQFRVIDLFESHMGRIRKTGSRMGRRDVAESRDGTGRYARHRTPSGRTSDIALDATIREAAAHQKGREKGNMAVRVMGSDIKEKVRERRSGCTVMFLVDASGSIGVRKRMTAVKGAVLSMLRESYVKRDRVGMMAFRRDSTELILPPTRSVEYGHVKLEDLPTGGKTPLGDALNEAAVFMSAYSRRHPGELCYIILLTDGRANVPMTKGSDAVSEAQKTAEDLRIPGVRWIVVDVGSGNARFRHARELAAKLDAAYFKLNEISADGLAENVKAAIGRS